MPLVPEDPAPGVEDPGSSLVPSPAGSLLHALAKTASTASAASYEDGIEQTLDALAAHLETHLDLTALLALARPARRN